MRRLGSTKASRDAAVHALGAMRHSPIAVASGSAPPGHAPASVIVNSATIIPILATILCPAVTSTISWATTLGCVCAARARARRLGAFWTTSTSEQQFRDAPGKLGSVLAI